MRLIVLALLLAQIFGTAHAYPLQGGDENGSVVLFGATRTPLEAENATLEILKLDVGLIGVENATYELVDSKDSVYQPGLYKTLQPDRQLVYFLIPQDDLFKLINVTFAGGKSFNINWWATPKGFNQDAVIRYYGITDWLINPDEQGIVLQLRVTNNGTKDLYIAPQNFTLLDQWGWAYRPTLGFDPEVVGPGKATGSRVKVGFTGVSLLSRPAALGYDYGTANQVIIDLEKDQGPLSNEVVYGSGAVQNVTSAAPAAATSIMPSANQSQAASAPAEGQTNQTAASQIQGSNASSKISSLKEQIAASKARLAATKSSLNQSTKNDTQNSTQNTTK
ncbi:MAG: hypothetical protein NTV25_10090 [Methanothrix sp.]|nr:hypothetical protein [Methanothrix sp.]